MIETRSIQQPVVMPLDGFVALAGFVAQTLQFGDLNTAAVVVDETAFMQRVSYVGNAGPLHAEHLRQEFLGECHRIFAGQIPCPEQPAGQSGLHLVRCVARRRLLGLYEQELLMSNECQAKCVAVINGFAEWSYRHHRGSAWKLNYSLVQRNSTIERGGRAHDTVASDHGRFDHPPPLEGHNERDDPAMG